ncbi:MAG: helix-turn-helix domain-containing protein [Thermoleophilia bacterium]
MSREATPSAVGPVAAIAHRSRRAIAEELSSTPAGLSVGELAERVALHPNAVRQHLRVLASVGVVSAEQDAPRGRGRPTSRYRLVDGEVMRVTAHQELVRLLVGALGFLAPDQGRLEEFARDHGPVLLEGEGREAITAALMRLGFAPHDVTPAARAGDGEMEIRLDNCPFREAVATDGGAAVCTLHRGLLDGMAAVSGGRLTDFVVHDPFRAGCVVRFAGMAAPAR